MYAHTVLQNVLTFCFLICIFAYLYHVFLFHLHSLKSMRVFKKKKTHAENPTKCFKHMYSKVNLMCIGNHRTLYDLFHHGGFLSKLYKKKRHKIKVRAVEQMVNIVNLCVLVTVCKQFFFFVNSI